MSNELPRKRNSRKHVEPIFDQFYSLAEMKRAGPDYWLSKTPQERLAALEVARRLTYGYDDSARMDKTKFEVLQQPWGKKPVRRRVTRKAAQKKRP